ncbi:acireductone synthase [Gallaecimonas kandeliae]|uniref:acireductone synthase n=1 Tax=Gallaecimonas kandeliae TaxID=3029055 RepID=UPI002649C1EF|nr:acireductone synthase [Gallaecimonas kandeliae]WKE64137.1 acireductone synthase [Gallaecimonas kandeliae]
MIKAVVMDVEGTTTDIAFVHKVLFPYARTRLAAFIEEQGDTPAVAEILRAVSLEAGLAEDDRAGQLAALIRWIDEDKKVTPLKALQGLIWRCGYEAGDFTGHVYPEVAPVLEAWRRRGLRLAVYSSGSVEAQQLLFGYSDAGDLQGLFEANFDTRIGHKREQGSYDNIAKALALPAEAILFLSDIKEELAAAKLAGFKVCQLVRPGTQAAEGYPQAHDFKEINP